MRSYLYIYWCSLLIIVICLNILFKNVFSHSNCSVNSWSFSSFQWQPCGSASRANCGASAAKLGRPKRLQTAPPTQLLQMLWNTTLNRPEAAGAPSRRGPRSLHEPLGRRASPHRPRKSVTYLRLPLPPRSNIDHLFIWCLFVFETGVYHSCIHLDMDTFSGSRSYWKIFAWKCRGLVIL